MNRLRALLKRLFPGRAPKQAAAGSGPVGFRLDTPAVVRFGRVGLWVIVSGGFLLGLFAVMRPPTSSPLPAAAQMSWQPSGDVGGFAQLYVATYLEAGQGTETSLQPFYGGSVDLSGVQPRSLYASRTSVVQTQPVGSRYWAVTVGADVLEAHGGSYASVGVRYYEVGVYDTGSQGLTATGLPAEVAAPARGQAPPVAASELQPPADSDPVQDSVSQFLDAYLTGSADVGRFLSPGASGITAPSPAPFRQAELVGVAVSGRGLDRSVLAEVQATSAAGSVQLLEYQIGLRERAGRWEVRELSGAPALDSTVVGASHGPTTK